MMVVLGILAFLYQSGNEMGDSQAARVDAINAHSARRIKSLAIVEGKLRGARLQPLVME